MKRFIFNFAIFCLVAMLVVLVYSVFKSPENAESIARAFLILFEVIEKVMQL